MSRLSFPKTAFSEVKMLLARRMLTKHPSFNRCRVPNGWVPNARFPAGPGDGRFFYGGTRIPEDCSSSVQRVLSVCGRGAGLNLQGSGKTADSRRVVYPRCERRGGSSGSQGCERTIGGASVLQPGQRATARKGLEGAAIRLPPHCIPIPGTWGALRPALMHPEDRSPHPFPIHIVPG